MSAVYNHKQLKEKVAWWQDRKTLLLTNQIISKLKYYFYL